MYKYNNEFKIKLTCDNKLNGPNFKNGMQNK